MKFSTRAEYGLKAMVNLAQCFPQQKAVSELSLDEGISPKYLERLMGMLRKKKLVFSSKGKDGGYFLARRPDDISAGEIIEALDGPIAPMKCAGEGCSMEKCCPSSKVWNVIGEQVKKTAYKIKLGDLIEE